MVRSVIRPLRPHWNVGTLCRILCLLSVAAVSAPAFFGDRLPLFRDAGNFYYPLWYYLTRQYRDGKLPLWNPYENLGAPLLANGTTAAFYPGIAIFLLPVPYPAAYAMFLFVHVLLSAWGAARLAGELGCRSETRPLAGLVYALAGPTFFQIHNPVYLVGGAWLPWILSAIWRILDADGFAIGPTVPSAAARGNNGDACPGSQCAWVRPRLRALRLLGLASAMSVLGGDPQTAYHGAVIAFGTWAIMTVRRFSAAKRFERGFRQSLIFSAISGGLLVAALGLAFLLAAVQILPSWYYAAQSDRLLLEKASVGRLWDVLPEENSGDKTWSALQDRRADTVYAFSVPPWRFAEMLWPNFGGVSVPVHERYFRAFLVEGRWWTPSLYFGVVPLLLALSAMKISLSDRKRAAAVLGGDATRDATTDSEVVGGQGAKGWEGTSEINEAGRVWLTWLGLFAATASLGWYGLGLLGNTLLTWIDGEGGAKQLFYPPAGGPYWWMVRLLPGYAMFRYPGKWLPLLAIVVACLSAMGTHLCGATPRRFRRLAWVAVGTSIAGVTLVVGAKWWGIWDAVHVPDDVVFGPFQKQAAFWHSLASFLWTAAAALLAALALRNWENLDGKNRSLGSLVRPMNRRFGGRNATVLLMLLAAVDLIPTARALFLPVRPPPLSKVLPQTPPRRVWRPFFWYPDAWRRHTSPDRLQELIGWERQTSFGRWGMLQGTANVQHYGTMMPLRYRMFLDVVTEYMAEHGLREPPDGILQWLGAEYLGETANRDSGDAEDGPLGTDRTSMAERQCRGAFLIDAWRVERHSNLASGGFSITRAMWDDAAEFFFPGGAVRRADVPAVIEIPGPPSQQDRIPVSSAMEPRDLSRDALCESVQYLRYAPGDLCIQVRAAKPRLLVVSEQYLPGWRVEVESGSDGTIRAATPVCVNRLFLGCLLPRGEWTVRWYYRQPGLEWGAWLSLISWLGMTIVVMNSSRAQSHRVDPASPRDVS